MVSRKTAIFSLCSLMIALIAPLSAAHASPLRHKPCDLLFGRTFGPTEEEWTKLLDAEGDLFSIARRNPKETAELNDAVFRSLKTEQIQPGPGSKRRPGLSQEQIQALFKEVSENPHVQESGCGSYRGSAHFGFCWGRAVAAHLKALHPSTRLHNQAVRKLWAVGDLRSGETRWRYHVTTIVRGTDGSWHAIDPNYAEPLSAEDWYYNMKDNFDVTKTMRIFATPATRNGAGSWDRYSKAEFTREEYKDFFADLMRAVHQENTGHSGWWDAQPRVPHGSAD